MKRSHLWLMLGFLYSASILYGSYGGIETFIFGGRVFHAILNALFKLRLAALLAHNARVIAVAGLVALASYGAGWAFWPLLKNLFTAASERRVVLAALGSGLLAISMLAWGMAGLLRTIYPALWIGLLAATGVLCDIRLRRSRPALPKRSSKAPAAPASTMNVLSLLTYALVVLTLINAFSPTIFYDNLVYRMGLPDIYLREGRIVALPYNVYAGFPQVVEMLYLAVFKIRWSPEACRLLMGFVLLGIPCLMSHIARQYDARRGSGSWAMLLFAATSSALTQVWFGGGDLLTGLYACAAWWLWLHHRKEEDPAKRKNIEALTGVALGFALGVKYTAGPFFVVPFLAAALVDDPASPRPLGDRLLSAARVAAFAAVSVSPWLVKNTLLYRNPLYPYAGSLFGGPADLAERVHRLSVDARMKDWSHAWDQLKQGLCLTGDRIDLLSYVGPVFTMALPWIYFSPATRRRRQELTVIGLSLLAWWWTTDISRFVYPALILIALLLDQVLASSRSGWTWWAGRALLWIAVVGNVNTVYNAFAVSSLPYAALDQGARDRYLSVSQNSYPYPPYPAFQFLNRLPDAPMRVLLVGENRTLYLDKPALANSPHDPSPIDQALSSASGEKAYQALRALGVTHLLVNGLELRRLRAWDKSGSVSGETLKKSWHELWDGHLTTLYSDRVFTTAQDSRELLVYRLDPGAKHAPPDFDFISDSFK